MCHMKTLAFLILNQYTEEIRINKDHCKEHCNVVYIFLFFSDKLLRMKNTLVITNRQKFRNVKYW